MKLFYNIFIMDYKRKYIKYKNKYLSLKQELTGGGVSKIPDDFIHVMSITKADTKKSQKS